MRWCKTRPGCEQREEFYCLRISSYSATIHWCEMGISGGNWPHLRNSRELWPWNNLFWKFCFCLWLVVVVGHPQTLMQEDIKCEKFTDYINNVWELVGSRVGPRQPTPSILGNLNQISYQIHQKSGHTLLCIDHKNTSAVAGGSNGGQQQLTPRPPFLANKE